MTTFLAANDPRADVWEPACFDPAELAEWRAKRIKACEDCEPGWFGESRAAGRCNGLPAYTASSPAVEEDMPDVVVEVRESHIDALLEEAARDAVEFLHLVVKGKAKLDSDGRVRMSASTALLGAYTRERQTAVRMRQLRLSEARMLPPGRSDD